MAQSDKKFAISLNDVQIRVETANGDVETIGMVQSVEVTLTVNKNTLYEAGRKGVPVDRIFLKKEVSGSFERVLVDKTLLQKLWPTFESDPVVFDLKGIAVDDKGTDREFTVTGCTLNGYPLSLDLENETKQSISFTGLGFYWNN